MSDFEFVGQQWSLPPDPDKPKGFWENAAAHRSVVTRILTESAFAGVTGSLAIQGAGVCNDIDLRQISSMFKSVFLFDIDAELCRAGAAAQGLGDDKRIEVPASCDVTGVHSLVEKWREKKAVSDQEIDQVIANARSWRLTEYSDRFDSVASTCLLSQLMKHVIDCLPDGHPRLVELLQAIRSGHLLQIIDLCKPGGRISLIFDFVSSESIPDLKQTPPDQLLPLAQKAVAEQNFFHGMNPGILDRIFKEDPQIAPLVTDVVSTLPWVWDATERQYIVLAIQCRKL